MQNARKQGLALGCCRNSRTTKSKLFAPASVSNSNENQWEKFDKNTNFLFKPNIVGVLGRFGAKKAFFKRKK